MTEAEKNEIVGLVMTEISSQAVDFDIETEQPQANDLLTAVRQTSSGAYVGVTIKWDDVARIATEVANRAAERAEQAKTDANNILEQVQSKGTDITNFVATSKTEIETQKNESVNAVKSVYQTDLNELKGDLNTEKNARIEGDTALSTMIQKVELSSSVNRYEIDNLKAKAEGKLYRTETVEAEAYALDVPSSVAPYAEVQKIGGKSVVWNQIRKDTNTTNELYGIFFTHKYFLSGTANVQEDSTDIWAMMRQNGYTYNNQLKIGTYNIGTYKLYFLSRPSKGEENNGEIGFFVYPSNKKCEFSNIMVIDLTLMFGSGNEPTLEECKKIFSADYYPYDKGTIKSFPIRTVRSVKVDGTEVETLDVSSVTSDLKSTIDVADEWSNGKIIRRIGSRAYTSGDESDSSLITDGTTTYYPLDTPTEETVPEIDNYIKVEGGGILTFESDDTIHMPVPSTDRFVVDLTSTTEETT